MFTDKKTDIYPLYDLQWLAFIIQTQTVIKLPQFFGYKRI